MHTCTLERILEHPEQLLEVATGTCRSALLQECLPQTLQVLALQLECLLEPVVILLAGTPAQVVIEDARISDFNGLLPGLSPVFRRLDDRRLMKEFLDLVVHVLARLQLVGPHKQLLVLQNWVVSSLFKGE